MKDKKMTIVIVGIIVLIAGIVGFYICSDNEKKTYKTDDKVLLFKVSDASKRCASNSVYVYANGEYEINIPYASIGDVEDFDTIATGTYEYDIDKVMEYLYSDIEADSQMLNYNVEIIEADMNVYVPMTKDTELSKFLDSLGKDTLFWCR